MSETRSMTTRAAAPGGVAAGGPRLGLALLVLATAQLMVVLDATIVNVALPHIQRALGFSGSGLEWVVNAYALAFGGLLLLGGAAADGSTCPARSPAPAGSPPWSTACPPAPSADSTGVGHHGDAATSARR